MVWPSKIIALGGAVAATIAGTMSPGAAADLFAAAPQPGLAAMQKVEFASGWYIRGDVGYEETTSRLDAATFFTAVPSVLIDAARGHQNGYVFSLGGGYKLNDWFRGDVTGDFRKKLDATTNGLSPICPGSAGGVGCYSASTASLTRYDVLANGYIDLGTWSAVTPYVGAGVGAAFGYAGSAVTYYQANGTRNYDGDRSSRGNYANFAWAVMAGAAIDVYDHTKLDIGYRYFNGGRVPNATVGASPLVAHEIRAGLRYMID